MSLVSGTGIRRGHDGPRRTTPQPVRSRPLEIRPPRPGPTPRVAGGPV